MEIRVAIDLPAGLSEVWAHLRDVTTHSDWMLDVAHIQVTSGCSEGLGLRFTSMIAIGPFKLKDEMEITAWEEAKVMGISRSGLARSNGTFRLSPTASGTTLSWEEYLELPKYLNAKLVRKMAKSISTYIWRNNLQNLRKQIIAQQATGVGRDLGGLINVGHEWELRQYGALHVAKVAAKGADFTREAQALQILEKTQVPSPALAKVLSPSSIVIERVDGPTMLEDVISRPWTLTRHAKNLARLHRALGSITAPDNWEKVTEGNSLVHLDLHPGNVKLRNGKPVVINWNRASRGSPAFDAAVTYVILRTADSRIAGSRRLVVSSLRSRFAQAFIKEFGAAEVQDHITEAAELRLLDQNLPNNEREAVFALARGELD